MATRSRACGAEHLFTVHDQFYRPPGFFRERHGQRLEIDGGLAAEAAADLGRHDFELRDFHAADLRGVGAHHELSLAAAPDRRHAVFGDTRDAGVRFDIALVHRLGIELVLDDDVGRIEAFIEVAQFEFGAFSDVRARSRRRLDSLGDEVVVQQRRVHLHAFGRGHHVRQNGVVDFDQPRRLLRNGGGGRGHGGDCVAVVERFVARDHIAGQVIPTQGDHAHEFVGGCELRKVRAGDDGFDAGQGERFIDVNGINARVCMGTAHHTTVDHVSELQVGAEIGPAGHFVDAVRPHWPRANEAVAVLLLV